MIVRGDFGSLRAGGRRAAGLRHWELTYGAGAMHMTATLEDIDNYWVEYASEIWLPFGGQTLRWREIRLAREGAQAIIEGKGKPEYA